MDIEQIKEILSDGSTGYFATINGEQLEVRGWKYQFVEGNKFYFTTSNTKDVYKQLQTNPQAAFSCVSNEHNVRISGKVTFVKDTTKKADVFSKIAVGVQKMYKKSSNPTFEVFYIGSGEVKINKGYETFTIVKF